MLEELRKHSRDTIIYVLFGVIIAVFVINFGPGSRGCGEGDDVVTSYAAKVGNVTLSEQDYRSAFFAVGGANIPPQVAKVRRLKEFIMDKLIERELLAQEAERLGLSVSQKEAEDMVHDGRMLVLGVPRKMDDYVFVEGRFDYERFKAVCQNRLGVTVVGFLGQQRRELMADRVRQLMLAGVRVLPEDVRAEYEQGARQVNLEFVRFQPTRYAAQVTVTADDIDAYRKAHEADLRKSYEEHSYLYKKLDKEVRLHRIMIKAEKGLPDADVLAAKAKAEDALKQIRAGKPFAEVARALSDDFSKLRGGDMGWKKKGFTGVGEEIEAKLFAAKQGDLIGPERSEGGWEVLKVDGQREGDVPFEAVSGEIAEEKLRAEKARALARTEADGVMAKINGGAKLEEIFPKTAEEEDPLKRLMAPPIVTETGLFARRGELIPEIGVSPELVRKAFVLKPGEIAGPFDVVGTLVIVRLKERKDPEMAEFEKHKADFERMSQRQKWAEVLEVWSKQRCVEMRDSNRLMVNDGILVYEGMLKKDVKYTACGGNALQIPQM